MGKLTRREFNLLLAAGALLPACASGTQGSATFAAGQATVGFAQFPSLMSPGGSAVVDVPGRFPIVVVRTGDADAVALSATCTHAFCAMSWAGDHVHCPCHDANFGVDGKVLSGPTSIPIPVYSATVAGDSIVVQIDD